MSLLDYDASVEILPSLSCLSEVQDSVCTSQITYSLCFIWACHLTAMFSSVLKGRLH